MEVIQKTTECFSQLSSNDWLDFVILCVAIPTMALAIKGIFECSVMLSEDRNYCDCKTCHRNKKCKLCHPEHFFGRLGLFLRNLYYKRRTLHQYLGNLIMSILLIIVSLLVYLPNKFIWIASYVDICQGFRFARRFLKWSGHDIDLSDLSNVKVSHDA